MCEWAQGGMSEKTGLEKKETEAGDQRPKGTGADRDSDLMLIKPF